MRVLPLMGALASLLLLTGCGALNSSGAADPTAEQPSATVQPSTPLPPTPASTPSPADTPSPNESYNLGPNGECDARQLAIAITAQPTASGMGHFYSEITFTNSSTVPCIVDGAPAIFTLIDAATNTPIGVRGEDDGTPETVNLQPGDTAYSTISFTATGVHDCATAEADAVQLAPPHWDEATVYELERPVESCLDRSTYAVSYVSSESLFSP